MNTGPARNGPERLDALIDAYLTGDATREQIESLSAAMLEDAYAANRTAEFSGVHAGLAWEFEAAPASFPIRQGRPWRGALFAAAGIALAAAGWVVWPSGGSDGAAHRLLAAEAAAWSEGPAEPGDHLELGRPYELSGGTIAFRTEDGVLTAIKGPASFTILGPASLQLDRGALTARAPDEPGTAVTVLTPAGPVRDLGTEFAVRVADDGASWVYVREGVVEFEAASTETLEAGQAAESTGGMVSPASVGPARDMPWTDMVLARHAALEGHGASAWLADQAALLRDPSLLLWLDADDRVAGIVNRVLPGNSQDARIEGSVSLTGGRLPSSRAIDCSALSTSETIVEIPGVHDALTLAAWVRLDAGSLPRGYEHHGLLLSEDWGEPGAAHWQVKTRDVRLTFAHPEADPHAIYDASRTNLDDGAWHMLAVVYDARAGTVTHYHNGLRISESPIEGEAIPLRLGRCRVGSTLPNDEHPSGVPMGGALDDLMVWSRALNAQELAGIHGGAGSD